MKCMNLGQAAALDTMKNHAFKVNSGLSVHGLHDLFVLRFYGQVNLIGSCRARSVYLITRLLGRLSPLSG